MNASLTLQVFPALYAVCRLEPGAQVPPQVLEEPFFSLMRTQDELSFTIPQEHTAPDWQVETGWRVLKVLGPLDFSLVGVLASIAIPLAETGISIFVSSTYDTDYIMVKDASLERALIALEESGFTIRK